MKTIKQLSNKIKSVASGISAFIPTQLSFWNSGQIVTSQGMNVFSQDIYEKLALLTTNINKFPVVVFFDGGISKFKVTDDKKFIDLPALSCAFQLQDGQGDNLPYKPYTIGYANSQRLVISVSGTLTTTLYIYAMINITNVDNNPTNVPTPIKLFLGTTTPEFNKDKCLLCIVHTDGSIDFSQTNFLVNSAVSTTNSANIIDPDNAYNAITPSALYLFKNQGYLAEYDPESTYQKNAQIYTVEDYKLICWSSNYDNNKGHTPTEDGGYWLLKSRGINADDGYQTYFPQISSKYIGADDIYAVNKVLTPTFKEYSTFNLALGKQDDPLSSGLAWVYEGRGAVKIYGIITITNNQSVALGINLDLSQQHSVNADAIANTFTKTPACKLITVGNVTTLNITQLEAPNFAVDWNVTVHGSLL